MRRRPRQAVVLLPSLSGLVAGSHVEVDELQAGVQPVLNEEPHRHVLLDPGHGLRGAHPARVQLGKHRAVPVSWMKDMVYMAGWLAIFRVCSWDFPPQNARICLGIFPG